MGGSLMGGSLMGGSDADLFKEFNEDEVSEALRRCTNCGRFVVIGPPRSGKSFFIEKHLRNKLGAGVTIDEHTLGITTAKAEGGSGLLERVMGYLERMMPLIGKFRNKVEVDVEEFRRVLGDRAPRPIVDEAKRSIRDSPHMAYYIPWERDEVGKCMDKPSECVSEDVGKALKLIKETFGDRRIKWFRAEYVPPGLVEEVIGLIKGKNEKEAGEVLRGWVDAYFKADETLRRVLGLGEDLLEWDESSVVLLNTFVDNYANYLISSLIKAANPLIGIAAEATVAVISLLAYMAFKRKEKSYVEDVEEIIEFRNSLKTLRVEKPGGGFEFNELGKLLVYSVAYAMGMSYEEVHKALMDITGLRTDELEMMVNEIKGRIEELEKKINELNNWINLLKQGFAASITIAGRADFRQGIVYPNIKVEDDELKIRVEYRHHNIVKAGKFKELVNGVRDKLLKHGLVVVVGPKGIGKSTLAAATAWELLSNFKVGLIARVYRLNEENYSEFATFIENYGKEFTKYFDKLLILYDPVSTETYEREPGTQQGQGVLAGSSGDVRRVRYVKMPRDVEVTIANLINVSNKFGDLRPPILIVIPSDFYDALSKEMRNALEGYRLDVSQALNDKELLAELIREYTKTGDTNGCGISDDVLNKLAGKVAGFDSGHALIARLIGEELARNNCGVGEVERLIDNAKGRAEAFVILHINGLFKVHKNPDTAKALVKVFALRRPFIKQVRSGDPILTPGVVKLMDVTELSGWLAHRQHDLIEEAIKKLLDCIEGESERCEDLGNVLEPWVPGTIKLLREVSEKVRDVGSAVKYFVDNYGKDFITTLESFSNKCWRRAALIIGYALAGDPIVPGPEDLPSDAAESLGDALGGCGVDDYLLVGDVIPPLIMNLTKDHAYALAEAFIDKYNEAVAEVRRVLGIAKNRGDINDTERLYGLGLVSIIANATELGKHIESSNADVALYIASFAIKRIALLILIRPILDALKPLRDKAPQRYLKLLALASNMDNLDSDIVRYILGELSYVLSNYGDVVKGYAWSLVYAIRAYAVPLRMYLAYFSDEVEDAVSRVTYLLNELDKLSLSLDVIAWADALAPALRHENVRQLMMKTLRINEVDKVVDKANEILEKLNKMRGNVRELMRDDVFMSYVESEFIKANEKAVRETILDVVSFLKYALALYRFNNGELDKAEELFNEAAEESREIGDHEDYLVARVWTLRAGTIKGSLVSDELVKLVDVFKQLYKETFSKEHFKYTARYLNIASYILGGYLVSLALTGDDETISKLLEEHWWVLNANKEISVLARLMLDALLGPKIELSSELKGKLSVNPEELIETFNYGVISPALMVAFGIAKPEDGVTMCMSINDSTKGRICMNAISVAINNDAAVVQLRGQLIDTFRGLLFEKLGLLKELGVDADVLFNEFMGLVNGLDGKSLVQLFAPETSMALLAFMFYASINGNKELAKAHALINAVSVTEKLLARLFLKTYEAYCNLSNEEFRRAMAKLFFLPRLVLRSQSRVLVCFHSNACWNWH